MTSPIEQTLPASWYSSIEMFNLEMRSVFHKSWLYISHTCRFAVPGDFLTFKVAGLDIVLIKDSTNQFQAYQNISGLDSDSAVLPEYTENKHGTTFRWKCDQAHNLSHANYDAKMAFRMFQDAQYKLKLHIASQGLIYVYCASDSLPPPFEDWYDQLESTTSIFPFDDYEYFYSYSLQGNFNWKTLVDGYQECYHCPVAHPGLASQFILPTYKVQEYNRWCRHYARSKTQEDIAEFDGLWMFMFPCNGVNCYSPAWYSVRVLPISAGETVLVYDIYTNKSGSSRSQISEFVQFMQQLNVEDFHICQAAQRNLETGIYSTGPLNPTAENGVRFYQNHVKDMVLNHLELERLKGHQVWPVSVPRPLTDTPQVSSDDCDYFSREHQVAAC